MPVILPPGSGLYTSSAYYGALSTGSGGFFETETQYIPGQTAWDTTVEQSYSGTTTTLTTNPVGTPLTTPTKVSYATAPVVRAVLPSALRLQVSVTEGIRIRDDNRNSLNGDTEQLGTLFSTGAVRPTTLSGWVNPSAAVGSDDTRATVAAAAGVYSTELTAGGFSFSIPANATITGIKVLVERSKI